MQADYVTQQIAVRIGTLMNEVIAYLMFKKWFVVPIEHFRQLPRELYQRRKAQRRMGSTNVAVVRLARTASESRQIATQLAIGNTEDLLTT
jgi:hypothetical protein